ncbi:MAG: agmatinase [Gammaproteobacteria bacterium]|nr:agmatinase [Gammaproteobacteria bacterium]
MSGGDAAFRRKDIKGTAIENSFSGALSFMRRKYTRDLGGVDVAVTGIPFDQAVSNRPGARFGPEAVRRATAQHAWGPIWPWRFDPFNTLGVIDYGDMDYDYGHIGNIVETITQHIATIVDDGVSTLTLGGDHFVTYPILKAYHQKYGPLGLVHFDAHRDFENDIDDRIDHGTMFTQAMKDGLIDPERTIQIGIRTCFKGERGEGVEVIGADEVHAKPAVEIADHILERVGSGPAYLTFDIDCLDPTFAPGTGTPVPGGLSTYQALAIIRALKGKDFLGMDVVEVSPPYDHSEITANAAAMIAIEMLCLKAWAAGARP